MKRAQQQAVAIRAIGFGDPRVDHWISQLIDSGVLGQHKAFWLPYYREDHEATVDNTVVNSQKG